MRRWRAAEYLFVDVKSVVNACRACRPRMRDIHSVYVPSSASGDFHWPGQIHAEISVALAVGGLVPAIYDDPAPRHLSLGRIFVASREVRYDAVAYAESLIETVLQLPVA